MSSPKEGHTWPRHTGKETHLVREIMRCQQAILGSFSRTVGVPAARLALVRSLALAGPEGAGVMTLARHLQVNAAAVTRQLTQMETEGLVEREAHTRDGRRVMMRLTPRGRRLFEAVHRRAHAFEADLTAKVSATDVAAAIRVLSAVRAAIEDSSSPST